MEELNPFIKWVGGKRRIAKNILSQIGHISDNCTFYEPFLGSGAILLALHPHNAVCSDMNDELINLYCVVKTSVNKLIEELKIHEQRHCNEYYYYVRGLDRDPNYSKSNTPKRRIERAARFLYLNKTCYNGLWRVNSRGQNNVPIGKYSNPLIVPEKELLEASSYFRKHNIKFFKRDYGKIINEVKTGDIVYFDPPYDVEEGQSQFIEYTKSGFGQQSQIELKDLCDRLVERGINVFVSNSNTKFIRQIYNGTEEDRIKYSIIDIPIKRLVGAKAESRKDITELLIVGRCAL